MRSRRRLRRRRKPRRTGLSRQSGRPGSNRRRPAWEAAISARSRRGSNATSAATEAVSAQSEGFRRLCPEVPVCTHLYPSEPERFRVRFRGESPPHGHERQEPTQTLVDRRSRSDLFTVASCKALVTESFDCPVCRRRDLVALDDGDAALAGPGEILLSCPTRDRLDGSGARFPLRAG